MEENRLIARRYFTEIMNMANMDTLYELLSPDFIFTLPTHPESYRGPDGFKDLVMMLHSCFSDFYIHVQDMVSSGDTVVTRWRGGGTHTGGALHTVKGDIQASGKKFEIDGMTWHRIKNGKIVEALVNEDTVGLMVQLGVLPFPVAPPPPDEKANLAVAHRYINEVMNQGHLEVIDEIIDLHFQFIIPTQPEPFRGPEGFKGFVQYLRNAFPDIKFSIDREAVDGDKVAVRWKITGTHKGEFLGAAPTEKFIEDYGIDIFTMSKGKILTVHVNENDFSLMRQIGIIQS
ncbi:ester cyclase [Desulfobulbus sp. F5]|nr:ester cyclase [Desulfobulbus sp. F5]